jgi:hypothetical protein
LSDLLHYRADVKTDVLFLPSVITAVTLWLSGMGALLIVSLTGLIAYMPVILKMDYFLQVFVAIYFLFDCIALVGVALFLALVLASYSDTLYLESFLGLGNETEIVDCKKVREPRRTAINKIAGRILFVSGAASIITVLLLTSFVACAVLR